MGSSETLRSDGSDGHDQSPPSLGIHERISIINALMTQDRIEIRERQEAMWKLAYYVIPAFIAIAGVFLNQPHLRMLLLTAEVLLLLLYIVVFLVFRQFLKGARACLQIRESYYKETSLLFATQFTPLRKIDPVKDYAGTFVDRHLWFSFCISLLVGIVMLVYMLIR